MINETFEEIIAKINATNDYKLLGKMNSEIAASAKKEILKGDLCNGELLIQYDKAMDLITDKSRKILNLA